MYEITSLSGNSSLNYPTELLSLNLISRYAYSDTNKRWVNLTPQTIYCLEGFYKLQNSNTWTSACSSAEYPPASLSEMPPFCEEMI